MSLLHEVRYIRIISNRLSRFKKVDTDVYNFRCPVCGDSKKDETKARGYFIRKKDHMIMMCHNCGGINNKASGFSYFLQWFDLELFKQFQIDVFSENRPKREKVINVDNEYKKLRKVHTFGTKVEVSDNSIFGNIVPILDLPSYHFAREYVENRKIPEKWWDNLYYAKEFKKWVNSWKSGKFNEASLKRGDSPRLVIACNNPNGWTTSIQGRDLTGEAFLRYYSINVAEDEETCFGLDKLNFSKRVYILEGPIDSMFIPNAIGSGSSSLKIPSKYSHLVKDSVKVFDNEPRNKDIVKLINKAIENGSQIYLPPPNPPYDKDINDWVMDTGITGTEIAKFIDKNTYQGLAAKLYFDKWKKV